MDDERTSVATYYEMGADGGPPSRTVLVKGDLSLWVAYRTMRAKMRARSFVLVHTQGALHTDLLEQVLMVEAAPTKEALWAGALGGLSPEPVPGVPPAPSLTEGGVPKSANRNFQSDSVFWSCPSCDHEFPAGLHRESLVCPGCTKMFSTEGLRFRSNFPVVLPCPNPECLEQSLVVGPAARCSLCKTPFFPNQISQPDLVSEPVPLSEDEGGMYSEGEEVGDGEDGEAKASSGS